MILPWPLVTAIFSDFLYHIYSIDCRSLPLLGISLNLLFLPLLGVYVRPNLYASIAWRRRSGTILILNFLLLAVAMSEYFYVCMDRFVILYLCPLRRCFPSSLEMQLLWFLTVCVCTLSHFFSFLSKLFWGC